MVHFFSEKVITGGLIVRKWNENNSRCPNNALFVIVHFKIDMQRI